MIKKLKLKINLTKFKIYIKLYKTFKMKLKLKIIIRIYKIRINNLIKRIIIQKFFKKMKDHLILI